MRDYYYYYYVRNVTGVKPALQTAVHIQRAILMSVALLTISCLQTSRGEK